MKKKVIGLSILLLVLLLGLSTTTYANLTLEEFEIQVKQITKEVSKTSNFNYYTWATTLFNSSVWEQYKNNIPFTDYSEVWVRYSQTDDKFFVLLTNDYTTGIAINSSGYINSVNNSIPFNYMISFKCDRRYWSWSYNSTSTTWTIETTGNNYNVNINNNVFTMPIIHNPINNQYNLEIYGRNYTASMIVPYRTINLERNKTHVLGTGFIGEYYYNDIQYKIYDNENNEIQNANLTYTEVNQGYSVEVTINTNDIISGNTYYIDLYYNNDLLFQYGYGETIYIVSSGGSSSGAGSITNASGEVTGAIDLSPVVNAFISGDEKIVSAIESGDEKIVSAIESGNNAIIGALTATDFSGDIGSGDFINYNVVDPTANFFDFLLSGISTVFLNNEEIFLPIDIPYIYNETYYLSSDFFKVTGPLLMLFNFLWVAFVIVPKINEVHEVIKTINMGYTDAFISYFGYGISINDLL